MVTAAVENLQDTMDRYGASMTIRSTHGEATIHPRTPAADNTPDPMLQRALKYMAEAEESLKNVKRGRVGPGMMFCCEAAQKQAINAAKKNLKQWSDFLATRALLTSYQAEMFDEDLEDNEDEDDF